MAYSRSAGRSPQILGSHPAPPHPFAEFLLAKDGLTATKVPHRALSENNGKRAAGLIALRDMIVRHHVDANAQERDARREAALEKLGFGEQQKALRRFPVNESTRKGNLAEIILAEYIVAARGLTLPVYRLRYNPNVDQSMKGDDVLAFDLTNRPRRIVIGEAKYRETPTKAAVTEILEGLSRSHKSGLPVSLQFVMDRLFETGAEGLGLEIADSARLFALDELVLEYVGLLVGNSDTHARIQSAAASTIPTLALISLEIVEPNGFVSACYDRLEKN